MLIICISSLLFDNQILSQETLTLSQAIETGLKNNFQIQIADQNIAIAQNSNNWAIAGRAPSVNFNVTLPYTYIDQKNPGSVPLDLSSWSLGVNPVLEASWILFDGYRVRFTKQQLEKLEALSQGNAKVVVDQVIQNIILNYYRALIQKEQLNVLREVLNLSEDRIAYQEARKEFGQAGTFDVLQTTDAWLNDSTTFLVQQNNYEAALRNLNLAMGLEGLTQQFKLTTSLDLDTPDYSLEDLQTKMLANNHQLQTLQMNREVSSLNTQIEKSANYPRLLLNSGASYQWNRTGAKGEIFEGFPTDVTANATRFNYSLNLVASYNLFDGGIRKRRVENAQMQEVVAQLSVADAKRTLQAQLTNTFANYENQQNLVQLTQNLIDNARRNLEIAEERFKGGLITSFDYRTIQLNYINASQARLNAIFNLKTTETDLIRLTGGLVR